jgi:hypothetical protein
VPLFQSKLWWWKCCTAPKMQNLMGILHYANLSLTQGGEMIRRRGALRSHAMFDASPFLQPIAIKKRQHFVDCGHIWQPNGDRLGIVQRGSRPKRTDHMQMNSHCMLAMQGIGPSYQCFKFVLTLAQSCLHCLYVRHPPKIALL